MAHARGNGVLRPADRVRDRLHALLGQGDGELAGVTGHAGGAGDRRGDVEGDTQHPYCNRVDVEGFRPATAVVIPSRNRLSYLREAVASVVRQDVSDWELVVVDDASTDGTWEWLQSLSDRRIQSVRRDEAGERAVARNAGLAQVRADAVLFLDDDDILQPGALRVLARSLGRHPDACAAVGARVAFGSAGRYRYPFPRWPVVRTVWREVLAGWVATPGQMLVRTAIVRAAGGWSGSAVPAEDVDLWLRVGDVRAAFVPATVLEYRIHDGARPPADIEGIEGALRDAFVAARSGRERTAAARFVAAGAAIRDADFAFQADDPRRAAASLARALRMAPALLCSPILGPSLVLSLTRAAAAVPLGRNGWVALRGAVRRSRAAHGRAELPS